MAGESLTWNSWRRKKDKKTEMCKKDKKGKIPSEDCCATSSDVRKGVVFNPVRSGSGSGDVKAFRRIHLVILMMITVMHCMLESFNGLQLGIEPCVSTSCWSSCWSSWNKLSRRNNTTSKYGSRSTSQLQHKVVIIAFFFFCICKVFWLLE